MQDVGTFVTQLRLPHSTGLSIPWIKIVFLFTSMTWQPSWALAPSLCCCSFHFHAQSLDKHYRRPQYFLYVYATWPQNFACSVFVPWKDVCLLCVATIQAIAFFETLLSPYLHTFEIYYLVSEVVVVLTTRARTVLMLYPYKGCIYTRSYVRAVLDPSL